MAKTIHRDDYRRPIEQLKDRREALGLNQTAMATAMGWSQQTYSAIESGTRRIDGLGFFAITRQLGLAFDEAAAMIRKAMRDADPISRRVS